MATPIIVHPVDPSVRILPAPGFPHYYVDELGGVWTLREKRPGADWRNGGWVIGDTLRPLNPSATKDGYLFLQLIGPTGKKNPHVRVSRLVLTAFVGPPPAPGRRYHAAHDDGDRKNNRLDNLRWATPADNEKDKIRHGTKQCGEQHYKTKLTAEQVQEIRRLKGRMPPGAVAKMYSVSPGNIDFIWKGQSWRSLPWEGDCPVAGT